MRSIQLVAPRTLEEREMPQPPDPGPGEVTVRIRQVGICGSDLHWYREGRIGLFSAKYPQVLGHEPSGDVVAVGTRVAGLQAGDRVVIEPNLTCGHCEYCLIGRHNNCSAGVFLGGPHAPGLFREYATVPARNVARVPDSLGYREATLVEPLAVAMHLLELVEIRAGNTVAILGAGPIGMLCAATARLSGAGAIFIADKLPHRLKLAQAMGAGVAVDTRSDSFTRTVHDATRGRGADVVIDAVGAAETINAGLAVARPCGTVVLIGYSDETGIVVDVHMAMSKELRLQTLKRSNHRSHAAIDLLTSGRVPLALLTHTLPLSQTPRAFEMLEDYSGGAGKVIIEVA